MSPTIRNLTTVHFDICKACIAAESLAPGQELHIVKTIRASCNGHSSIGSFLITRYDKNRFEYRCWGNIALKLTNINGNSTFEITEL